MIKAKLSSLVKNQFPDFYQEEGQNFLAFIEAYYEYLEQNGKLTDAIQNLEDYKDINTTLDEYLDYFQDTLLPSVPHDVLGDKRLMAKYVKNFNIARGTEASYRLLFRSIYNEDIEVNYPSEQMLKISDGDWRLDRYLVTNYDTRAYGLIGRTIQGRFSGARALVEDVVGRVVRNRDVMQILISNVVGKFEQNEPIKLDGEELTANTYSPKVEVGITSLDIINAGAQYQTGDVVELLSDKTGDLGKVVVTGTVDLGGAITFDLKDGGSGYTSSANGPDQGETQVLITGGDGQTPASFTVDLPDIGDRFAIYMNTDLIGKPTIFGEEAPNVNYPETVYKDANTGLMNTFANTLLSSPNYGFQEQNETETNQDFFTNANAVIVVANTKLIPLNSSLYGSSTGANAHVTSILVGTDGAAVLKVNTYKNFDTNDTIHLGFSTSDESVGTVTSFSSNAVGRHILDIGVTDGVTISEGDEFVSVNSNEAGNYSFGVVKKIISQDTDAYTHDPDGTAEVRDLYSVLISANSTSQLTNQFDIGPIVPFREEDGIKVVGSSTVIANVATAAYTSNTNVENIHMAIGDCIIFKETTFGTVENLSNRVGGSGFSVAPGVKLIEPNISTLGIGEQYVTLETDSDLTATTDSNDKLLQGPASGDLKHVADSVQQPDGKWHTVVRCWQQFLQRDPGNIYFANNANATLEHYGSEYIPGTIDSRTADSSETVKIVKIIDEGVLGKNAIVEARVGADGTATGFRIIDSGFSYTQGERVRVKDSGRTNSSQAVVDLTLLGAANSQGYYATSRSHVSTKRGYIQDSGFYQEYSYQVVAPLAVERYRDMALKLVHPAGQALFGKYQLHSNVNIDIVTSRKNTTMLKSAGTVSIAEDSSSIVGTGTEFTSHFGTANSMIVEITENNYINIPLNSVTNDTTATAKIAWNGDAISNAKIYYRTGEIT